MSALCDVMRVLTSLCVLFFIQAKTSKSGFSTELGPAKRQVVQKPKGVQSESVKAFLQKKEQEEKAKGKSSIFKIIYKYHYFQARKYTCYDYFDTEKNLVVFIVNLSI